MIAIETVVVAVVEVDTTEILDIAPGNITSLVPRSGLPLELLRWKHPEIVLARSDGLEAFEDRTEPAVGLLWRGPHYRGRKFLFTSLSADPVPSAGDSSELSCSIALARIRTIGTL